MMIVIYCLFGYSIKNSKIGFPKSSFNKVINTLDENKINYEVIGENIKNDYKKLNGYMKFKDLGFKKYNKDIHYSNLVDKVKKLDEDKLDRILEVIEDIVNE